MPLSCCRRPHIDSCRHFYTHPNDNLQMAHPINHLSHFDLRVESLHPVFNSLQISSSSLALTWHLMVLITQVCVPFKCCSVLARFRISCTLFNSLYSQRHDKRGNLTFSCTVRLSLPLPDSSKHLAPKSFSEQKQAALASPFWAIFYTAAFSNSHKRLGNTNGA